LTKKLAFAVNFDDLSERVYVIGKITDNETCRR